MNPLKIGKERVAVELSSDELGTLCNALNEVCNGIEVWEFDTRMGISVEGAKELLEALTVLYDRAKSVTPESSD